MIIDIDTVIMSAIGLPLAEGIKWHTKITVRVSLGQVCFDRS